MILIAGIGNIFLGDDGFGVEAARRLAERPRLEEVELVDFGIRGMDLAYTLMDDYEAIIFLDAAQTGQQPGTVSLIKAELPEDAEPDINTHGMDPVKVLALARALGAKAVRTYVVACEPEVLVNGDDNPDVLVSLSEPVLAAIDPAVAMVEKLVADIRGEQVASCA